MYNKGNISEIFCSIQGEGIHIGVMQIFIRYTGCNLRCRYCDTLYSHNISNEFTVIPYNNLKDKLNIASFANPISADKLVEILKNFFAYQAVHSISITGGEPFLQPEFLYDTCYLIKKVLKQRVFIETNGTLYQYVGSLEKLVDIWSVDLKISSTLNQSKELLEKNIHFINLLKPQNTYLKLIISNKERLQSIIEKISPYKILKNFTLVIQPIQNLDESIYNWDTNKILVWIEALQPYFREVRWIPQIHKILRIP